jgi:hypothetical protein
MKMNKKNMKKRNQNSREFYQPFSLLILPTVKRKKILFSGLNFVNDITAAPFLEVDSIGYGMVIESAFYLDSDNYRAAPDINRT